MIKNLNVNNVTEDEMEDDDILQEEMLEQDNMVSETTSSLSDGTQDSLLNITVQEDYDGIRIDKYLSETIKDVTRSYLQKLISEGQVFKNKKPVKANTKVSKGDIIELTIPSAKEIDIKPQNIPLDILYEDDDVILVNKPKGMVVHPAAGHYDDTLVNALMYHCHNQLSGINGVMRPGIVHRIDRDTTGVLIVCKNDKAHQCISAQLKEHSIHRVYEAIVYGVMNEPEGRIEGSIGRHPNDRKKMAMNVRNGKPAATNYKVLEVLKNKYTHIECKLETGRTHQIRVHMASTHHPLLGDTVYGPSKDPFHINGQALHARVLGFIHPTTNEYMEFEAPLPEYFRELLDKLK